MSANVNAKQSYPPPWAFFKYIRRQKSTENGRKDAARIRRALASDDTPHSLVREIEVGIEMMLFCAGMTPSPGFPYHIQFLAAHQYIQDAHADLKLCTPETVSRLLAVCRAANLVRDALNKWEKGRKK